MEAEPIRWKDTPEEAAARAALRVQPGDFTEIDSTRPNMFRDFQLSPRIVSGLMVRDETQEDPRVFRLAKPNIVTQLTDKLTQIIGLPNPRGKFVPFEDLEEGQYNFNRIYIDYGNPRIYSIGIGDAAEVGGEPGDFDLSILIHNNATAAQRAAFPQMVQRIKDAVADVALSDARKKFLNDKTANRVGQAIGLDPLAVKKEIGEKLGGRRKTKTKAKTKAKKQRKTRRRLI
jgi:hypothetical protein